MTLSAELGPHLTQCGLGRGLATTVPCDILIHPAVWPKHIHGPKSAGLQCPCFVVGAGSPINTMSPGPRPISVPSRMLIHPAVWPQQTWAENWGTVPLLRDRSWVGAEVYLHGKFNFDPSNRLTSIHQCYRHTTVQ